MFKSNKTTASLLFIGFFAACSAQNAAGPVLMSHEQFVENFANNAAACFSPIVQDRSINCKNVARFAHYTLTFIEIISSEGQKLKIEYKLPFKDKNGLSCIERQNLKPEKIRVFKTNNLKAEMTPEDIEIRSGEMLDKIVEKISMRENSIGEICHKYSLVSSSQAGIQYKIIAEEMTNGAPNGKKDEMAIFSNGTPLFLEAIQ